MKMTTDIPPAITTPDSVETSLGTLTFVDGLPDQDTVQKVYDNLDRMPGIEVFLNTLAPASLLANTEWLKSVGWDNYSAVIHEDCVDAKTLLLTPNTQTATLWASRESCRDAPNRLDTTEGWNFLMRIYRPGRSVLEGAYKLPAAQPVR